MWDAQTSIFSQHFRVLRYDTRGHGQSSAPTGPYSIADLGNDVLGLLDFLAIPSASVCGVSLGGMTALWLAIHSPRRIERIVAANTAARIGTAEGWNSRIEQVQQQGMKSLTSGILERWFTAPFRSAQTDIMAKTAKMLEDTSPDGYAACCAAIRDMDQTADVAVISALTLCIAGSDDPVTPPSDLQFLSQAIPHAQYLELQAAHLSNIESADAFNSGVLAFLAQENQGESR
jgi:3-oxoadipate enol-lactonase